MQGLSRENEFAVITSCWYAMDIQKVMDAIEQRQGGVAVPVGSMTLLEK